MTDSDFLPEEEQEVLSRLRDGDMSGLTNLYHAHRKAIHSLVIRNSGSQDDGDDLLHEALIILWQRVRTGRFEHRARIGTFLYGTARNLWLRRLARQRREPRMGQSVPEPATSEDSALDLLIDTEESALVRGALDRLPEPCRSLLIAFYWEELSMDQIAARFGLANADTAKSKKYQCKNALRKLLEEQRR